MASDQDALAVTKNLLDKFVAANPSAVRPASSGSPGMLVLKFEAFDYLSNRLARQLNISSSDAENWLRLVMSRKPMALDRAPEKMHIVKFNDVVGGDDYQRGMDMGAGDTSYYDGDQVLLERIIKDQGRVQALDQRWLRLAQNLIDARKRGNEKAMQLIPSVLREYRDWKVGQRDLPFMESEWNQWSGRLSGFESVARSSGANISGSSVIGRYRSRPRIELVGDRGHRSDLTSRDKRALGGFASGGTFIGKARPARKVKINLVERGLGWVGVLRNPRTGQTIAVTYPQTSRAEAMSIARKMTQRKGWIAI